MTLYIPDTLPDGLVAVLAVDPPRRAAFTGIVSRLEPDRTIGDKARAFVIMTQTRKATLRSALTATGQSIPKWARDGNGADKANAAFLAEYRAAP